jgi:hypothetical protein
MHIHSTFIHCFIHSENVDESLLGPATKLVILQWKEQHVFLSVSMDKVIFFSFFFL